MDIFMTGGSGFVGRALCRQLVARGHKLRCLVRTGSEPRLTRSERIEAVTGELLDPEQLIPLIEGADAVIHLIGIIREFPSKKITFARLHHQATRSVVSATEGAGVKRFLHMSANGTRRNAQSDYHKSKWLAEEAVRQSTLNWTIFRPSLIYGPEDRFINLIASLIRKLPVVPVVGDGQYQMQPVPVSAIAQGFTSALDNNETFKKIYHCGGADCLSYNQLLELVGATLGKTRVRKLPQPLVLMRPLVALLQHLPSFPMTSDQLQMLLEGNCCDSTEWLHDLNLESASFQKGLAYLKTQ